MFFQQNQYLRDNVLDYPPFEYRQNDDKKDTGYELMLLLKVRSLSNKIFLLYSSKTQYYNLNQYNLHSSKFQEAEQFQFTAEELQVALKHCGNENPISWLNGNWNKLVQAVQSLSSKYGLERPENTIGLVSNVEAREALRIHKGNVWQAVSECIAQRQRKFKQIYDRGGFPREDITNALSTHNGNMELALLELEKAQMKPFLMRVWGASNGTENESGNFLAAQFNNDFTKLG